MRRVFEILAMASALFTVSAASVVCKENEDATRAALVKIAGEGLVESHAFEYLTQLSDDVGARVTGSPESQKAVDWSLSKMRAIGLENVHAEKFQIWRGWRRGTAQAELTAPIHRRLSVDAMGWTASAPAAGVEGQLVAANMFNLDAETKDPAKFTGKIILMVAQGEPKKGQDGMLIFTQFSDFVRLVAKNGAVAIFGGQGGFKSEGKNLTHTGILGFSADFNIPVLSLTTEDQNQLERFLDSDKKVHVRVNVHNTFSEGPVETANAVGEIRGREHPEES